MYALHAAAGVEYGEGFAGNAHRHAPEGWMPAVKYLVEELGADVNQRDNDGYTPLHHAAARGDNEMILVPRVEGRRREGRQPQRTHDGRHGQRPGVAHLAVPGDDRAPRKLGAVNNNRCQSCAP